MQSFLSRLTARKRSDSSTIEQKKNLLVLRSVIYSSESDGGRRPKAIREIPADKSRWSRIRDGLWSTGHGEVMHAAAT